MKELLNMTFFNKIGLTI